MKHKLPGLVPLTLPQFEQRYSVPEGGAPVAASAMVDWIAEVKGQNALSWWLVTVWAAPPKFARRAYRIKALDDNMAAREGLRTFEREYAAGLIS